MTRLLPGCTAVGLSRCGRWFLLSGFVSAVRLPQWARWHGTGDVRGPGRCVPFSPPRTTRLLCTIRHPRPTIPHPNQPPPTSPPISRSALSPQAHRRPSPNQPAEGLGMRKPAAAFRSQPAGPASSTLAPPYSTLTPKASHLHARQIRPIRPTPFPSPPVHPVHPADHNVDSRHRTRRIRRTVEVWFDGDWPSRANLTSSVIRRFHH